MTTPGAAVVKIGRRRAQGNPTETHWGPEWNPIPPDARVARAGRVRCALTEASVKPLRNHFANRFARPVTLNRKCYTANAVPTWHRNVTVNSKCYSTS
jgi:hypothetical protein